MSATNEARLRQQVRLTETPDADLHAEGLSTVEAACHEFLRKRGLIHNLTSRYCALPVKEDSQRNAGLLCSQQKEQHVVLRIPRWRNTLETDRICR